MSDNYLELWFEDIGKRNSWYPLRDKSKQTAWGEYKHKDRFARVHIGIEPNENLYVSDQLGSEERQWLKENEGQVYNYIVFGVLDVMLTTPQSPSKSFKLDIIDVDIHQVRSSAMAFRLAARDATHKILRGETDT